MRVEVGRIHVRGPFVCAGRQLVVTEVLVDVAHAHVGVDQLGVLFQRHAELRERGIAQALGLEVRCLQKVVLGPLHADLVLTGASPEREHKER